MTVPSAFSSVNSLMSLRKAFSMISFCSIFTVPRLRELAGSALYLFNDFGGKENAEEVDGDGLPPQPVVQHPAFPQRLVRPFCGFLHRNHPRPLFAGVRLQEDVIQLDP